MIDTYKRLMNLEEPPPAKKAKGFFTDTSLCIGCNGCGFCVPACPFGVIDRAPKDGQFEAGTAHKCTLCYDRLKDDMTPACAKACPTASIQFGDVDELRARARHRLGELKERGESKARLYGMPEGEEAAEVGPLHALFLLLDKPHTYHLPDG